MRGLNQRILINISLALLVGLAVIWGLQAGYLGKSKNKVADRLFLKQRASGRVIIVSIDSGSINEIGQWPWPREITANLIDKIQSYSPELVAVDINFFEESRFGKKDDHALAEALASSKVVLPQQASTLDKLIINGKVYFRAEDLSEPIAEFKGNAAALGHVNVFPDNDGIVRQIPLQFEKDGKKIKAFSLVIAETLGAKIPREIYDKNLLRINYFGPPSTFDYIPAKDVLSSLVGADSFKNKIVLIGATSPDLHDTRQTPTSKSSMMPGVEIHANAVETILQGKYLKNISRAWTIVIIFLLVTCAAILFIYFRKIYKIIAVALFIFIIYNIGSILIFNRGVILNLVHPNLAFVASFGCLALYQYFAEGKEKAFLRQSFKQYLAPSVVERIIADPKNLKLGGQKRELTVLFSDIRGFTSISEKIDPEQLVNFLNRYFTAMTGIILKYRGVVDKFIGDAIMAFWGAPEEVENHAEMACRAALEMKIRIGEFKKELAGRDINFNIGVGINTGEMVVGNLGSEQRFDYTVIGDSVNLASRIESLNKEYKTNIIISEFTKLKIGDSAEFNIKFLGEVTVRGKTKPVKIYELS